MEDYSAVPTTIWMTLENVILSQRSDTVDYILHDSIYMTCPE